MLLRCSRCSAKSAQQHTSLALLLRSACECGNASASGYDRTPLVSLRSASVTGFYADRPAKKRRPPPVKTRSILTRASQLNARGNKQMRCAAMHLRHCSTARGFGEHCCSHAAALPQHGDRGGQPMCRPPLSEKSAPVAKPDSSEASHAQIEAISAGSPRRLTGIVPTILSSTS